MGLEALKVGKWPVGRCMSCSPQPDPLGKAPYVATTQLQLRLFPVLLTNFSPVGDWDRTRHCVSKWRGREEYRLTRTQLKTNGLFTVNLGPCHNFISSDFFVHLLHLGTDCSKQGSNARMYSIGDSRQPWRIQLGKWSRNRLQTR